MARRPVNLETMLEEENVQRDLQEVKYAVPEDQPDDLISDEPNVFAPETQEEPTAVEPIQVAGKIDLFTGLVKGVTKRVDEAERRATPTAKPEALEQRGEDIVVRKASDEEEAELATTLGVTSKYTKGLNLPAIAEAAKDIDMAVYLQKIKDDNAELFETVRRGTISYANLLKMAEEKGVDHLVREFIKPGRKSAMRAEDILAGLIGAQELSKRTQQLAERAFKLTDPAEREAAFELAANAVKAEVNLYAQISGEVSEAARSVFAMREAQRVGLATTRGEELNNLLQNEGIDSYERFFEAYLAIPPGPGKAKFLQRGWHDKSMDFLSESFINAILSHPVTHMVNVAGNTGFNILRGAEEAAAATHGLVRSAVTGNKDRVYFREALIQLDSMRSGFVDATLVSAKSFKRGEALSDGTKIDTRSRRAIGSTDDLGEIIGMYAKGDVGTAFINTFGVLNRMSSRFLTAEDEFFKGIQYQAEIKKQARVRSFKEFDLAIERGDDVETATQKMGESYAALVNNPPEPMRKTASDISKEATFQAEMGKIGATIEPLMAHPLAKLFAVPFYRTPTNVIKETFKRSPFGIANYFYKAMKQGGREADLAFGRFATGTGIASLFATYAIGYDTPDKNIIITGSPLNDREAQQARQRLNIQDFSINIKREDGSGLYDSYTYSRLDPMSGLLAMSSDFAYYVQHEDDIDAVTDVATALGMAVMNYSLEMPFLQGVQELGMIFSGSDTENIGERLNEFLASRATAAALSTVPAVASPISPTSSSLVAGFERIGDPEMTETRMLSERFGDVENMSDVERGFYLELQRAMSRNPFFNEDLPPRLNLWGEPLQAGRGVGWEIINPIRIAEAKYQGVDKELLRIGDGISMPNKKMGGVRLSAEQYNRFIMLTAQSDYGGSMPGSGNYDAGQTLADELLELVNSRSYQRIEFDSDKLKEIRNVVESRRSDARAVLLDEYPELAARIDARKQK